MTRSIGHLPVDHAAATGPLPKTPAEERDRARLYTASRAADVDELRLLLDALGLNEEDS
ncbi:hypothetical protein [Streptomyces lydicamycinicus]|uniref:hypothetical protein n=1 Tax=Streptomyces lydicamycinicus TaxID=1546107 RepID=UPI003C2C769B